MATAAPQPGARRWSDMLAILTGVALLAISIWPGEPTASGDASRDLRAPQLAWLAHIVAGALAIGAVFVAQAWRRLGMARAMLVAGAALLLIALVVSRLLDARSLLSLGLPAVALLAASWGLGPMPGMTEPTPRD